MGNVVPPSSGLKFSSVSDANISDECTTQSSVFNDLTQKMEAEFFLRNISTNLLLYITSQSRKFTANNLFTDCNLDLQKIWSLYLSVCVRLYISSCLKF